MKAKPTKHSGEIILEVDRRDEPLLTAATTAPFRLRKILVPIDFSDCSKKALQYALEHGADVINLSLSGPSDPLLSSLIAIGLERKIAVVAAFDNNRPQGGFPASIPGVIAVAEESLRSVPARVYRAPGRDVPTTQPGGKWYLVNGSSFAAAHVTGLVALLREARSSASPATAIARTPGGPVDACATLVAVTPGCNCSCAISMARHGK